ncbi:MAG: hypothetical protein HKN03_10675 [Acidimicrobiales bacterium]|nr:hypothetical protein [Acidimicrobiales bacterium]
MHADSSDFLLFGPLTASCAGRPVRCGGKTERAVLATLLLHPGRPVDVDTMAQWVWPLSRRPADPCHAIQTHIMRLRRHLGRDAVATDGHGYHTTNRRDQVDVHRFEFAVHQAENQHRRGQTDEAIESYTYALQVAGSGTPLPDLTRTPAGRGRQAELAEARLNAQEQLAILQFIQGRPNVGELERLALMEPFREMRWIVLIHALCGAARHVEALRFCHYAAVQLKTVGLTPSRGLQEIEQLVLNRDEGLGSPTAIRELTTASGPGLGPN